MLLCPRDYLSTFMKIGTILLLALGILLVLPPLRMPAVTPFIDGTGPVFAGKLFPFAFITIACGAISGFHALVASGTTPKMIMRESDARLIGYGGMLMESFVAVMALCAATLLDPGVYFAINAPLATLGGTPQAAAEVIRGWGFTRHARTRSPALAAEVGEQTLLGRAGGAPSLAVGMAHILSGAFGQGLMALWYHFAIMFEALFILTTRRHRHPRRPVHAAGAGGPRLGAARPDLVVSEHHRRLGAGRGRVGLLPRAGRHRPAGRHQLAVAALRHQQPAPRRRGAVRRAPRSSSRAARRATPG